MTSARFVRRGFTLIEVIVALVLTGMIALAVRGALDAGLSARERIAGPMEDRERALLARAMLEDALRHAVDDDRFAEPFARSGGAGTGDILSFTTRGIVPPLGASGRWRVLVQGDRIDATPIDERGPRLRTTLPGVRALRVMTLQSGEWRAPAANVDHVPPMVRVEFTTTRDALPPLVARTAGGVLR
jgi:prepilin-type N-terminal cleavage/methylation domain-containing protein